MNLYLEELNKYFKNRKLIIIMDNAGWHKSKSLKIPENIEIIFLPPYSPELNPIERLWKHIKKTSIHNILFQQIDELIKVVCKSIKKCSVDFIKQICACNYI